MKCIACGAWKMPHRVCKKCGVYNGKTLGKIKKVKNAKK
jgi:ribosomal protein L32